MPASTTLIVFALTTVALVATPGPNLVYILGTGVGHGRRLAVASAFGVELGTLAHVLAAVVGISALLAASAAAFEVVRWAGVTYLVYLGVRAWRSAPPSTDAAPSAPTAVSGSSMRRAVLRGFTVNALNPKVALFFLALFPQFTDADAGPAWVQMLVLGFVFVALAMTIDLAVAVASGSVGRWLACRPRLAGSQPRVTGAVYLGIGLAAAAGTGQR